jgi:hypothetical protein
MKREKIIDPVPVDLLKEELNQHTFVRKTNKGNNEIYIVNFHNAPNTLREIGRLREITFTQSGGGTGQALDIDIFDTSENCYQQIVLFSPEDNEIIGGYRFIDCSTVYNLGLKDMGLSTRHYFNFSDKFISDFLPYTIELGRSWVQPNFQPSVNPRKGIFALDNLWDGLGAISVDYKHIKYFFGKVTMYPHYNSIARDAVLVFLKYFFEDKESLVTPINPLSINPNIASEFLKIIEGKDFKDAHKDLQNFVRNYGENIPPLINNYIQLSPTMKSFGTALNPDFGGVEETGIMVNISDIYEEKKERHVRTYVKA